MTLDQIERVLHADRHLTSLFAAFHHSVRVEAMPAREVITPRSVRQLFVIGVLLLALIGLIVLSMRSSGNACPGSSAGRIATTAARYPTCLTGWTKVSR